MNRFLRILFLLVGLAVALVAGVFGLVLVAVLVVVFGLFALFGKGRFNVTLNRRPRHPGANAAGSAGRPGPVPPGGDVIDVEATKVESRRSLE